MLCQLEKKISVYIRSNNKQICLICDSQADTEYGLCSGCERDLPWLGPHCQRCAIPLPMDDLLCGECLRNPPAFQCVVAPWRYGFPVDSLITHFKHRARWPLGRLLGELLARHLQHAHDEATLPRPEVLLPVPLAAQRLRGRGFNQAQMLSHWLGRTLNISSQEHWLMRKIEGASQQGLSAKERLRNLRNAFCLHSQADVQGRHIAIVDDVLTTGATSQALAKLLMAAGAKRVDVYCLARTPKPHSGS